MKDKTIFKEKLYHHTMPVRDGLWEAIEAKLPPKKEERIFPLFWFTLFATTLLGGALMIGFFNQKTDATTPTAQQQNDNIFAAATHSPSAEIINEDIINSTASSTSSTSTSETAETKAITSITTASEPANNNSIQKKKYQTGSVKSPYTQTKKDNTQGSTAKAQTSEVSTLWPLDHTSDATASPLDQINSSQIKAISNGSFKNQFSIVDFLPLSQTSLTGEETEAESIPALKPDPSCYKFTGPGSQWAISADLLGGPGFSPKTYEQNSDEFSVYADARKATENNQYAWSIGARINLHHRSGLTGRLGIQYTQAGDIFDYTDSLATQSTTRIDSFFAADGTFLYTETSQVLILGTLIKKIHNTYRYLDIPLVVGYEMPLGRSILMINAGPVLNITSSHEGQILDSMLHPRSITDGEPGAIDVYKTNLGLSVYLSAGMLFPLTDLFSALVEPSFLYRLNPVTLGSYQLKERRHYVGLNLGLRYHFN